MLLPGATRSTGVWTKASAAVSSAARVTPLFSQRAPRADLKGFVHHEARTPRSRRRVLALSSSWCETSLCSFSHSPIPAHRLTPAAIP